MSAERAYVREWAREGEGERRQPVGSRRARGSDALLLFSLWLWESIKNLSALPLCVCECGGGGFVSVRAIAVCVWGLPWCGCEYDGRYEKGRSAFSLVEAAAKWANMSVMNYVFALYINKPSLAHTLTLPRSLLVLVAFSYWCARWLSPHPSSPISNPTPFSTSFPHFFPLAVFLSPSFNTYYFLLLPFSAFYWRSLWILLAPRNLWQPLPRPS